MADQAQPGHVNPASDQNASPIVPAVAAAVQRPEQRVEVDPPSKHSTVTQQIKVSKLGSVSQLAM